MEEGLSRAIEDAKRKRLFSVISIGRELVLSHLLFDVLCFCLANGRDVTTLKEILQLFKKATGMEVNEKKSAVYSKNVSHELLSDLKNTLPFQQLNLDGSFKYLGI